MAETERENLFEDKNLDFFVDPLHAGVEMPLMMRDYFSITLNWLFHESPEQAADRASPKGHSLNFNEMV